MLRNKLTLKSDLESKNLAEVETYSKKDCDNLKRYGWQGSQGKGVTEIFTGGDLQILCWGDDIHKTKGKVA